MPAQDIESGLCDVDVCRRDAGRQLDFEVVRSVPVSAANSIVPAEGLRQAESELGINEWPDPETVEPAEGQSPPHLDKE